MVFTLQTETKPEGKYSIAEEGQGSPFRLNHLADKPEKAHYGTLLYGALSANPAKSRAARVPGTGVLYMRERHSLY